MVFGILVVYHLIKIASTICLLLRSMPKNIDVDLIFEKVFQAFYLVLVSFGDWMIPFADAFKQARAARLRRLCSRRRALTRALPRTARRSSRGSSCFWTSPGSWRCSR